MHNLLFSLLKSGLSGGEVSEEIRENINEDILAEVYNIAERHDIANIVGEAVFKNSLADISSEVAQNFKRAMLSSVVRYQKLRAELSRICKLFEENGICHMPLKGAVMRKFYPDPWMRTSGDVDVLVKKEDAELASKLLVSNFNYKNVHKEKRTEHDYGFYAENGTPVELHYELMEKDANYTTLNHKFSFSCSAELAWESAALADNSKYCFEMSDDVFYIYHISHTAKHFINGGCGIRPFLDLWILNTRGFGKSDYVKNALDNDGLSTFWHYANELAEIWFGGKAHNNVTTAMEKYVLSGGVHGSEKNKFVMQKIKHDSKIGFLLTRIFVPYKTLKFRYDGLAKYPFLLPVYWVRRWAENLLQGKLKNVKRDTELYESFSKDEITETKNMLSELDII